MESQNASMECQKFFVKFLQFDSISVESNKVFEKTLKSRIMFCNLQSVFINEICINAIILFLCNRNQFKFFSESKINPVLGSQLQWARLFHIFD